MTHVSLGFWNVWILTRKLASWQGRIFVSDLFRLFGQLCLALTIFFCPLIIYLGIRDLQYIRAKIRDYSGISRLRILSKIFSDRGIVDYNGGSHAFLDGKIRTEINQKYHDHLNPWHVTQNDNPEIKIRLIQFDLVLSNLKISGSRWKCHVRCLTKNIGHLTDAKLVAFAEVLLLIPVIERRYAS